VTIFITDRSFLDTNIIVYAFDKKDPEKNQTARKLIESLLLDDNFFISSQVILEFINVAYKKIKPPMADDQLYKFTESFPDKKIILINKDIIQKAIRIRMETQYSIWDSLIISAALSSGCTILYSEDLSHGKIVDGLQICNPFL